MSDEYANRVYESGFSAGDFELLGRLAGEGAVTDDLRDRLDGLWSKAERLIGQLGAGLFGVGGYRTALWPDSVDDDRLPFLWGRIKRAGAERFATHVGLFLSPDHCNLCIDLEKDVLDAGESAESLRQVLDFYDSGLGATTISTLRADSIVWTDAANVVAASGFAAVDFARFMEDNGDPTHPWPKTGYILDDAEVTRFADRWVDESLDRGTALVPIYDAMIDSFTREE